MRLSIRGKRNIMHWLNKRPLFAVVAILIFLFLAISMKVYANTALTQTYLSDESLPLGSIVSLEDNSFERVVPATISNVDNILGVVVNDSHSKIKLSSNKENQVHVATSGVVSVLVSDINGKIEKGDHITASAISGVGMNATRNVKVVGVAQADLTEKHSSKETYTDGDGNEHTVLLGEVPVLVEVSYFYKEPEKTLIPPAIQNIANSVAGKTAKPLPIIISAGIFLVTLIAVSSILFSSIRGSIISVGRNPMSQSAVYRNLMQISALVLGILSVAIVSIYLILSRF